LLDIPLAITAFSAADIDEAGIQDLEDLADLFYLHPKLPQDLH